MQTASEILLGQKTKMEWDLQWHTYKKKKNWPCTFATFNIHTALVIKCGQLQKITDTQEHTQTQTRTQVGKYTIFLSVKERYINY